MSVVSRGLESRKIVAMIYGRQEGRIQETLIVVQETDLIKRCKQAIAVYKKEW